MSASKSPGEAERLTPHVRIRRAEAVINPAAGGVTPGAAQALEEIVSALGLEVRVTEIKDGRVTAAVEAAVAARPDVLIVLAGDGTARLAAELCGSDGPLLAPLPGGTMNMLPHALYGDRPWREALRLALSEGVERAVSGGEVEGRSFYVAAILGAPALWADAREAVRGLHIVQALFRAQRAVARAFAGELHFELDQTLEHKAEALSLVCPLVSAAIDDEDGLEVAALDPQTVGQAFRLGLRTAFGQLLGDWRHDPAVTVYRCQNGRVVARGRIPAILDGEPYRFGASVTFSFKPKAFRALALPPEVTGRPEEPQP